LVDFKKTNLTGGKMKKMKSIVLVGAALLLAGEVCAQQTVLVVRDMMVNGGDAAAEFSAMGASVDVIPFSMLASTALSPYCVVYVSGIDSMDGDPVNVALNDAVQLLESYVGAGGTLFYETGSDANFLLPGGVTTVGIWDWENFIVPGHPIADTLPWMLSGNCAAVSENYFENLPPGTQVISTTSWLDNPVTVSYPIGAGEVIASGILGEYFIMGTTCWMTNDQPRLLWQAIAQYCIDTCIPGGTAEIVDQPLGFSLADNYPNPFNPLTTIEFNMTETGQANLSVYDLSGQLVETLIDGLVNSGVHSVAFDARDLSSGVYFYTLSTDNGVQTKKMVLTK
jgi:hypothetical protein